MLHHKGNYRLEHNITAGKIISLAPTTAGYLSWSHPELHKIFFPISEPGTLHSTRPPKITCSFHVGLEQAHTYFTFLVLLDPHFSSISGQERY